MTPTPESEAMSKTSQPRTANSYVVARRLARDVMGWWRFKNGDLVNQRSNEAVWTKDDSRTFRSWNPFEVVTDALEAVEFSRSAMTVTRTGQLFNCSITRPDGGSGLASGKTLAAAISKALMAAYRPRATGAAP